MARSTSASSRILASGSLRASAGRLRWATPVSAASFSRICKPVVPASPSIKIVAVMIVSKCRNQALRRVGRIGAHGNAARRLGGDYRRRSLAALARIIPCKCRKRARRSRALWRALHIDL